jgi:hypothetical protein
MWKPDESLDDFIVRPDPEEPLEPQRAVSLRLTGEVELLKPLAYYEAPARQVTATIIEFPSPAAPHRFSWFHRSLAVGGALAMIVLVLSSAILIGISDPSSQPALDLADLGDAAIDAQPEGSLLATEEPFTFDIFTSPKAPIDFDQIRTVNSRARRRAVRPRVQLAAYRQPRRLRRPQTAEPKFVPTTLVIYLDKGEVKTRIEPQLTAVYTKPVTFPIR